MASLWIKDQLLEQTLRRLGIAFDIESVPFKMIDREEGLRRQSRLIGHLQEDYVLRLAVQMSEPDARFKMGLLQKPVSSKAMYWPWSANHRYAAFPIAFDNSAELSVEAYTCKLSDPLMMDVISTATNCIESEIGFSREERLIKARFWIEKHNMSVAEAARIVGVKPEAIYNDVRAADTKGALEALGIGVTGMSKQILRKLAVLQRNRNVLRSAAQTLLRYSVKGNEAESFITDVARGKTEAQMIAEIGRWESIFEQRAAPKRRGRPKGATIKFATVIRDRAVRHLTGLEKILSKNSTLTQLQINDPADFETAKRAAKIIVPRLISLFDVR